MNPKNPLMLAMLASATLAAVEARAATYTEVGDAGQALPSAQYTAASPAAAGQSLTAINGTISGSDGFDADLYVFTITSTTTFSATAVGGTSNVAGNGQIDTSLFLFNSAGVPIIANDDQGGASYQGAIPVGNSLLTSLSAGTYYLAISLSGNEAVNLNNQQLFTVDQPTTNVRGIASGLNPTTLGGFNGQTYVPEGGSYSITLTGASTLAAVPEPGACASLALGAAAAGAAFLRRKSGSAA